MNARGVVLKKKWGTPETRLRQRLLNNLGLRTCCTEIVLHCVSVSNQLQQWTDFCTNLSSKKVREWRRVLSVEKSGGRRPPASPPHYTPVAAYFIFLSIRVIEEDDKIGHVRPCVCFQSNFRTNGSLTFIVLRVYELRPGIESHGHRVRVRVSKVVNARWVRPRSYRSRAVCFLVVSISCEYRREK